jgi:hypothetical protein
VHECVRITACLRLAPLASFGADGLPFVAMPSAAVYQNTSTAGESASTPLKLDSPR